MYLKQNFPEYIEPREQTPKWLRSSLLSPFSCLGLKEKNKMKEEKTKIFEMSGWKRQIWVRCSNNYEKKLCQE